MTTLWERWFQLVGLKKITVHSPKGPNPTTYWQLPENNIICRLKGHVFSRLAKEGTSYEGGTYCFRCGFDSWTDPWT